MYPFYMLCIAMLDNALQCGILEVQSGRRQSLNRTLRSGVCTMANKPVEKKRFEIVGNEIIIRFPLTPGQSKAGKSIVIASTRGRETFTHEGESLHVNLNVYKLKEA